MAAAVVQAIGESRDHGRRHALSAGGWKREQVFDHADAVRRQRVGAVGDDFPVKNGKMKRVGGAFCALGGDGRQDELGRHVEIA